MEILNDNSYSIRLFDGNTNEDAKNNFHLWYKYLVFYEE